MTGAAQRIAFTAACLLAAAVSLPFHALAARARGRTPGAALGNVLARTCARLGPAYVKVGQLLSTRGDLLSEPARAPLARLRDDLPPLPPSGAHERIAQALACEPDALESIEPIAAGSVACVYRVQLRGGPLVAVKLRRPDLDSSMRVDLRLLRRGSALLARLPWLRAVPVTSATDVVATALEGQLDFRLEAERCRRLGDRLGGEAVRIPVPIEEWSSDDVLTMEYLEEADPTRRAAAEPSRASVARAVELLYAMIFTEGLVHCDLHPGNLVLGPGDRVTLVDFGLAAEIGADDRQAFAELFYAMAENDGELAARIAIDTATHRPSDFDERSFVDGVRALIAEASGARPADFQVALFAGRLIDLQRRHGLHSTTAFTMPIAALLTLEGTIKEHAPTLDFQALARPFVMPALLGSTRVSLPV